MILVDKKHRLKHNKVMPKRVKKNKSIFTPIADNFLKKISTADKRIRRKIFKYGFWIVGIFFIYSLISSTYGIKRIVTLQLEKNTLIDMNRQEFVKLVDGQKIRNLLLHDKEYIEYIARTRYHMVYPGETIYRYQGQ